MPRQREAPKAPPGEQAVTLTPGATAPSVEAPQAPVLPRCAPYGFTEHRDSLDRLFRSASFHPDRDENGPYMTFFVDMDEWTEWCDRENDELVRQIYFK